MPSAFFNSPERPVRQFTYTSIFRAGRSRVETHRGQDGDEITLSSLIVQRSIDRNLSLVRQVDAEVAVSVRGGDSVASYTFVANDPAAVARRDGVFDDAVDTGVSVDRVDVLEYRRADRSELRADNVGIFEL